MSEGREKKYVTVSLPIGIIKAVDALIRDPGYWPSRGAFVREACLEKIWVERRKLKALRNTVEMSANPCEVEGLAGGLNQGISPR
jgi:Arc/MetJ-type ribon-helix-helix transcriptional regulator